MEDLFRELTKKGILKEENPRQLAVEYYAPLFFLISMFDKKGEKAEYGLTVSRVLSQEKGLYRRLVSTHGKNGEKE